MRQLSKTVLLNKGLNVYANFCWHRADAEGLQAAVRSADAENAGLRRELDERSREVEQLTTLSLKGDATVQASAGSCFYGASVRNLG